MSGIYIFIDTDSLGFEDDQEVEIRRILSTIPKKIEAQKARDANCVCSAPESDDYLFDYYGNVVGTVHVRNDQYKKKLNNLRQKALAGDSAAAEDYLKIIAGQLI